MQKQIFNLFKTSKVFMPRLSQNVSQLRKNPKYLMKMALSGTLLTTFFYVNQEFKKASLSDDLKEVEVGNIVDFKDGDMKQVQVGPDKDDVILVSKVDGKFYASGAKCSHFGAPLEKGVLFDDRAYCPWHDAAFSVITGYPEQGPVVDGIPTYPISEKDGKLTAKVPKDLKKGIRLPLVKRDPNDKRKFVIIGAGPAGLSAIETLRQSGYTGEIVVISKDQELPYDRTMLSKNIFNNDINKILLRDKAYYDEYGITVLTGSTVSDIQADAKTVEIAESKEKIKYDKLLIASGSRVFVPDVKGANLKNVLTLRTYTDLTHIKEAALNAKNIVVIGSSFIGMEVATAIKGQLKDKVNIVVVDGDSTAYKRALGEEVGNSIQQLSQKRGLTFQMNKKIKVIEGDGAVTGVELHDGTKLPADLVVLGTGVRPNTEFAKNAVKTEKDGGISTDTYLQTSKSDIFAAGDIASFPYWYLGDRVRVEHYNEALKQGSIAAFNMLDKKVPLDNVPFFWTRIWDFSIHYIGLARDYDEVWVDGDLKNTDEMKFIAYYGKNDKVLAVATTGRGPVAMVYDAAMALNVFPKLSEIKKGNVTLEDIKNRIREKKGGLKCKKKDCCQKK